MSSSENALQKYSAKTGNVIKKFFFSPFSALQGVGQFILNQLFKESRWGVYWLLYDWFIPVLFYIMASGETPGGLRLSPALTVVTSPWFDSRVSLTFYQASREARKCATHHEGGGLTPNTNTVSSHFC